MAAKKSKKAAKKPAAKKAPAKKPMKKAAAKKPAAKAKKPAAKRKPNAAFMKPMTPSATLAAVVGNNPMPRTEVTSKLWGYIKKNNLQDKANRRMINADDKLKEVFGGKKQVSMFEMTKLVAKHLK
jgi:upstream activation factor subunit UAF30